MITETEMIKFACWLSGNTEETVKSLYDQWLSNELLHEND